MGEGPQWEKDLETVGEELVHQEHGKSSTVTGEKQRCGVWAGEVAGANGISPLVASVFLVKEGVCELAQVTRIRYHMIGRLKRQKSIVLETASVRSRCRQGWFLPRPLSSASIDGFTQHV